MPRSAPPTADPIAVLAAGRAAVEVLWHDSWADHEGAWESRDDVMKERTTPPIRSVGVLMRCSPAWLWITQSVSPHELGHTLRIPRACVVSVRALIAAANG